MKILKQVEGSKIVLYSFEMEIDMIIGMDKAFWAKSNVNLIFKGTKSELHGKDDEFWKPLVEEPETEWYKNYQEKGYWHKSPSESGRSAIEDIKGEFILITQEKI